MGVREAGADRQHLPPEADHVIDDGVVERTLRGVGGTPHDTAGGRPDHRPTSLVVPSGGVERVADLPHAAEPAATGEVDPCPTTVQRVIDLVGDRHRRNRGRGLGFQASAQTGGQSPETDHDRQGDERNDHPGKPNSTPHQPCSTALSSRHPSGAVSPPPGPRALRRPRCYAREALTPDGHVPDQRRDSRTMFRRPTPEVAP